MHARCQARQFAFLPCLSMGPSTTCKDKKKKKANHSREANKAYREVNWAAKTRFVPCPTGLISWLTVDARLIQCSLQALQDNHQVHLVPWWPPS